MRKVLIIIGDADLMRYAANIAWLWLGLTIPILAGPDLPGITYLTNSASKAVAQTRELRCTACHRGDLNLDLKIPPAPDLRGASTRLDGEWLHRFLMDPTGTKPGTRMPDTLHQLAASERKSAVEALLHFLHSIKGTKPGSVGYRHPVSQERGRETFEQIGCVACHGQDTLKLGQKWRLFPLIDFLQNPLDVRPDGRMPDHQLSVHEAADIAVYLLPLEQTDIKKIKGPKPPGFNPKLAEQGREYFKSWGCANCHDTGVKPTIEGSPLSALRGKPDCSFADYGKTTLPSTTLPSSVSPRQQVQSLVAGLQCNACHTREGTDGWIALNEAWFTGDESLAAAGRIPPTLNHAGRKLRSDWLKGIIGKPENRLRGYMHTRMPVFGLPAAVRIADALKKADHQVLVDPFKPASAEAGRKLVGLGGMNCITCHDLGDWKSLGIPGLNLTALDKRLRPVWFKEYLLDPSAYRSGTLMPGFWPKGVSTNPHILEGDTDRQISAIWTYLKRPDKQPDGYPPEGGEFEIRPADKPVVMRTFMKATGPHALAIGMPGGLNLVFDTKTCRFTELWKGKFIDGYSTWFDRFVSPTEPLGTDHLVFVKDLPAVREKQVRFDGYELNGKSVRLLSRYDGQRITFDLSVKKDRLTITLQGQAVTGKRPGVDGFKKPVIVREVSSDPLIMEVTW